MKKDHQLVTTGPYAVVRHPAYTGTAIGTVGALLCHLGPGSWARECGWLDTSLGKAIAVVWAGYVSGIALMLLGRVSQEDEVLREQFPEQWATWAKRTPYRLIPFIF